MFLALGIFGTVYNTGCSSTLSLEYSACRMLMQSLSWLIQLQMVSRTQ